MKRGLMEPDPRAVGLTFVASLWLMVFVLAVVDVLLVVAE